MEFSHPPVFRAVRQLPKVWERDVPVMQVLVGVFVCKFWDRVMILSGGVGALVNFLVGCIVCLSVSNTVGMIVGLSVGFIVDGRIVGLLDWFVVADIVLDTLKIFVSFKAVSAGVSKSSELSSITGKIVVTCFVGGAVGDGVIMVGETVGETVGEIVGEIVGLSVRMVLISDGDGVSCLCLSDPFLPLASVCFPLAIFTALSPLKSTKVT